MELIRGLTEFIPMAVIIAVIAVIFATEFSKVIVFWLEEYLETKLERQIKLFDHSKILLLLFWTVIAVATLVYAEQIDKRMAVIYFMLIVGASTILYELVIKKVKKYIGDDQ